MHGRFGELKSNFGETISKLELWKTTKESTFPVGNLVTFDPDL